MGNRGVIAHNFVDIKNQKFGRLTALDYLTQGMWRFRCDCGNEIEKNGRQIRFGHTKSCGCLHKETSAQNGRANKTHGMTHHPLFGVFVDMKRRCYNEKYKDYGGWGGRGIKICSEWLENPEAFFKWGIENGWQKGLSIDRIDNNGNYEPNNCRFATALIQNNNNRNCVNFEYENETKTLSEWSRDSRCKVPYSALWHRTQDLGWKFDKALTTKSSKLGEN